MTKSPSPTMALLLVVATLLVLAMVAPRASAVTCRADQVMKLCMPAFKGTPHPSLECCSKLKEQEPCMCGYMKDPDLKKYWDSPKAKTICDACHVPFPPKCK